MWRRAASLFYLVASASACTTPDTDIDSLAVEAMGVGSVIFGFDEARRIDLTDWLHFEESDGFVAKLGKRGLGSAVLPVDADTQFVLGKLHALCGLVEWLEADRVEPLEPVFEDSPPRGVRGSNDEEKAWNMRNINVERAWAITKGRGARVMILERGMDTGHSDLESALFVNQREAGGRAGVDDDGNGYVDDLHGIDPRANNGNVHTNSNHGTHVSGIVGGRKNNHMSVGVAPESELVICNFVYLSDLIECADYAEDLGIRVMNYSFGGEGCCSNTYTQVFNHLRSKDILFVTSAGNSGENLDTFKMQPQGMLHDHLITVANLNSYDDLDYGSCYSKNLVELAAPGKVILNAIVGNKFAYMSGTSMAAPHVSGCLALMFAANPGLSAAEAKRLLLTTVRPLSKLTHKVITGGTLDCGAAVEAANAQVATVTTTTTTTTTTPSRACSDAPGEEHCPYWAGIGFCEADSQWHRFMQDHCAGSCKFCDGGLAATTPPPCSDVEADCWYWVGLGFCDVSNQFYPFMRDNCRQGCGLC